LEKTKFLDFAAKFNRHYQSTEDMDSRFGLYLQTKNMIDNAPLSTFKMELNHFADRTDAEKQAALNHYIGQPKEKGRNLQTVCPAGQYLKDNKTCTPCSTAGCKTCPNNVCS
jgi:ferredoxin-like protein FixX